jgi:hypothetical protein
LDEEVIKTLNLDGVHYLNLSTQEIETIGLEESTISYFALMSQLGIPLQIPTIAEYPNLTLNCSPKQVK